MYAVRVNTKYRCLPPDNNVLVSLLALFFVSVRSNSSDCIKVPGGVMSTRTGTGHGHGSSLKTHGRAQSSQSLSHDPASHFNQQSVGRSQVDGYQNYEQNLDPNYRRKRKDSYSSGRSSPTSSVTSELSTRSGSSSSLASSLTLTSFDGR